MDLDIYVQYIAREYWFPLDSPSLLCPTHPVPHIMHFVMSKFFVGSKTSCLNILYTVSQGFSHCANSNPDTNSIQTHKLKTKKTSLYVPMSYANFRKSLMVSGIGKLMLIRTEPNTAQLDKIFILIFQIFLIQLSNENWMSKVCEGCGYGV